MKLKKFLSLTIISIFMFICAVPAFAGGECVVVTTSEKTVAYSSFESGWNYAVSASKGTKVNVVLKKDITASDGSFGSGSGFKNGALKYSGSADLTLDLNGYTIDRNLTNPQGNGTVIYVQSTLTIIDSGKDKYSASKLFKGGAITGGSNDNRGGGIIVENNGTLNFNGGTILNCVSTDDGGAVSLEGSKATMNVNGGNFYGNRTFDGTLENYGGAIYIDDATVNINNSVFEGNYAEDDGGAIYVDDGKLTINNSVFNSNKCKEEGGAIHVDHGSDAYFENCTFTENSSGEEGGALYLNSGNGITVYNCNMYYNYSSSEGGGIHINVDNVYIVGGNYMYNSAGEQGGGIYVDSMYDTSVAGKLVVKNNTAKNGKQADFCLQEGNFSTAYLFCGGLYEGSEVYLCSNDTSSQLAIKGIDIYQYRNYIHFDSGFKEAKLESSTVSSSNIRAEGAAIGNGNLLIIIIMTAIVVAAAVVILIVVKKKKKGGKERCCIK